MYEVKQEIDQKAAVTYFDRDTIIQAKKVLYAELSVTTRIVTHSKDEDNILNMCKTLVAAAKQNVKIPKFVILIPCEVPTIGEAVNATVVSNVNELSRKLDCVLANMSHPSGSLSDQSLVLPQSNDSMPKPSYAVILKNPPKELKGPTECQAFIDSLCPSPGSDVSELHRGKNEWKLVISSKEIASLIVEKAKRSDPTLNVTLKESAFVAVVKQAPDELVDSSLKELIPKCIKIAKLWCVTHIQSVFQIKKDFGSVPSRVSENRL